MTSKLVLDNIAGRTTAGSITIVGEGNSTTTNLQQGLCKVWVRFNGSTFDTSGDDTFNVTSLTDDGTGDYTITIANDFSNINFVQLSGGNEYHVLNDGANTVTTMQVGNYDHNHSRGDTARCFAAGLGDLA